ncbi:hypothetical protein IMY05_001G0168200 [Salix suchowensis]|nr:hypothetical protein IMY05_001G0168200 [Salix suchowensis]
MNGITNILFIAKVARLMLNIQISFDGTCLLIWNVTSEVENLLLASHNILMGHF